MVEPFGNSVQVPYTPCSHCVFILMSTHPQSHTRTHILTCTHTHAHTHTHTHTQLELPFLEKANAKTEKLRASLLKTTDSQRRYTVSMDMTFIEEAPLENYFPRDVFSLPRTPLDTMWKEGEPDDSLKTFRCVYNVMYVQPLIV